MLSPRHGVGWRRLTLVPARQRTVQCHCSGTSHPSFFVRLLQSLLSQLCPSASPPQFSSRSAPGMRRQETAVLQTCKAVLPSSGSEKQAGSKCRSAAAAAALRACDWPAGSSQNTCSEYRQWTKAVDTGSGHRRTCTVILATHVPLLLICTICYLYVLTLYIGRPATAYILRSCFSSSLFPVEITQCSGCLPLNCRCATVAGLWDDALSRRPRRGTGGLKGTRGGSR